MLSLTSIAFWSFPSSFAPQRSQAQKLSDRFHLKRIKTCSRSTMSEDPCWKAILWSCSDRHAIVEVDDEIWIVPQISLKKKSTYSDITLTLTLPPSHLSHSFGPGTFALNSDTYKPLFEKIVDPPLPSLQSALAERVTRLSTHINCLLQTDSLTLTQCHQVSTLIYKFS